MRTFAEEERMGTMEGLLTAPVTTTQVVLSKYLACFTFYLVLWAPMLLYPKMSDIANTYTHIRYGIETLMRHFLDARFSSEYPAAVAALRSDEYYVNMMIAWYFATALAKQYEAVLPFLENRALDPWTHNKAIRKAIESRRLSDAQKAYLRTLQIK